MIYSENFNYHDTPPQIIRDNTFGATFKKEGEELYLRMELLTQENSKKWTQFREMSVWVSGSNRGILPVLVIKAGTPNQPSYETIKECSGFTEEEYFSFIEKAIQVKKTNDKITKRLQANSEGTGHMRTTFEQEDTCYIAYICKNRDFSMQESNMTDCQEWSLNTYRKLYDDILISVGSNFSKKYYYFENRGISRNPFWVFEEKFAGLSMLLHGFTGAVAKEYFKEKESMLVIPLGSMQAILKKNLLPGEGYAQTGQDEKTDITELDVSPEDPEGKKTFIKVSALTRIYQETIEKFGQK